MKSSISNIDTTNTGDRGDCMYLPVISNRTLVNSIDDKNEYTNSSFNFECTKENCFRSNLASGEPEQNQVYFSTSSATFIVSSSPPSEITIEQNEHNINHSKTNMELFTSMKECNNPLWFKEHWISITISAGMIVIFIIIITTIMIILF
jgi:hypothetical protein